VIRVGVAGCGHVRGARTRRGGVPTKETLITFQYPKYENSKMKSGIRELDGTVRDSLGVESRGPRSAPRWSLLVRRLRAVRLLPRPVHTATVPCRSRVVEYTTVQEALRYRSGGDNDQRTPSAGWLAGSMISIICFTKRRRFIWARSSPTPG
jgi:hypothetical protein